MSEGFNIPPNDSNVCSELRTTGIMKKGVTCCYGLNYVPQKDVLGVLIPSICECDLIWK